MARTADTELRLTMTPARLTVPNLNLSFNYEVKKKMQKEHPSELEAWNDRTYPGPLSRSQSPRQGVTKDSWFVKLTSILVVHPHRSAPSSLGRARSRSLSRSLACRSRGSLLLYAILSTVLRHAAPVLESLLTTAARLRREL